jgi:hypothetical protein
VISEEFESVRETSVVRDHNTSIAASAEILQRMEAETARDSKAAYRLSV